MTTGNNWLPIDYLLITHWCHWYHRLVMSGFYWKNPFKMAARLIKPAFVVCDQINEVNSLYFRSISKLESTILFKITWGCHSLNVTKLPGWFILSNRFNRCKFENYIIWPQLCFRFEAVRVTDKNTTYVKCHQNAVVFALSSFQYIQLSIVFSRGAPYRKPFYKSGK